MSAVVGNLVVNLEARTIRLEQSLNRVEAMTKRSAKQMESAFGKVKTAFAGMLTLGAVYTIANKVKSALDMADEIVNTADSIGVLTSEYQKLQYLAEQAGIEQEAFNTGLAKFAKTVGAASQGGKQAADIFNSVGISIKGADGSLRSTSDILMDAADRFNALGTEAEKAKLATDLFGRSGIRFSLLLSEGSEKIREMAAEAERLGIVLDDSLLRKAEEAGDALNTLNRAANALITEAIITMAPQITNAANALTELTVNLRDLQAAFESGQSPMLNFVGGLGSYTIKVFKTVGSAIGQLTKEIDGIVKLVQAVDRMDWAGAKSQIEANRAIGKGYWNDLKAIWNPPAAMPEINVPEVAKSGKVPGTLHLAGAKEKEVKAKKEKEKLPDYSGIEEKIRLLEQERQHWISLADSIKRTYDPTFELNETQKELNTLWEKGLISAEVKMNALADATERQKDLQNRLLMGTKEGFAGAKVAMSDYLDKVTDSAQQTYDIMTHTFEQLESTLADFFTTGKLNFQDFAASIVAEMNKILVQKLIMAPLVKSLGMSDLFNFGGARAMGGPVFAGSAYMVGERGPEYFVPNVSGRIEPNGKGGGEQTIQQNFTIQTPNADSFRRSQDQVLGAGAMAARRTQWRNGR